MKLKGRNWHLEHWKMATYRIYRRAKRWAGEKLYLATVVRSNGAYSVFDACGISLFKTPIKSLSYALLFYAQCFWTSTNWEEV